MPSSKVALRRHLRHERLRLLPAVEPMIQVQAQRLLPTLIGAKGRLGLYWPLAGEVDLRGLVPTLGGRLALPAVVAAPAGSELSSRLTYRPWQLEQPLVADACGIPAPPGGGEALDASDLALLLVPALAVDRSGYRLGYGGGWYDRLRSDAAWARVPALAVLPSACLLERLPSDPWDIPLAGWLTEAGVHWL